MNCKNVEKGLLDSKGGALVRALASHPCGLGSNPDVNALCGLNLLLVLSFTPRGFFSGYFPLSSKTNISKFKFDQESGRRKPPCGCATSKSVFINLFRYTEIKEKAPSNL